MQSIVITGFMGTGKSTIARLLAARLGWGILDLDEVIAAQTGRTIPSIFQEDGEPAFRALEQKALAAGLERFGLVIATGGGALMAPEAMALARSRGRVIALDASMETLWKRIAADPGRPLLVGGLEVIARLKRERDEAYRRAEVVISTDGRAPLEVVNAVHGWLEAHPAVSATLQGLLEREPGHDPISDLEVPLGARRYWLEFAAAGRFHLGSRVRALFPRARKAIVVTNPRVGGLYGADVLTSLLDAGLEPFALEVPDGEHAKSLKVAGEILDRLIELRLERREPLIALGGGVVGDLTGFVASIYQRGIPFVQVPTTLLAQVDSSIGGKTGVNSPRGKNLIGSFHQPAHVLIDVEVLRTLDEGDFRAGLAEVIKYGAIRDLPFLRFLEQRREAILARNPEALEQLIHRSCANKAAVIVADELEQGDRALLNFGHTLGHALETLAAYERLRHGQAVAMGMAFAARLSRELGLCPEEDASALIRLLEAYGLPVRPPSVTLQDCLNVMSVDKKVSGGAVQFVVLESLGRARLETLGFDRITPTLRRFLEGCT